MKRMLVLYLLLICCYSAAAQRYKYIDSAKVVTPEKYTAYINNNSGKKLIEIKKLVPDIRLDIRYATTHNFTGQQVYKQARAFARLPVVKALQQVQADLNPKGLALKIFDAYRPYTITVKFYEIAKDTTYVADPRKGSRHNRGCAVDLTLIDLKTGRELDMPTGYDSFEEAAWADYAGLSEQKLKNRELLRTVMEAHGFTIYPSEWWHYDFTGWEQYELMNIPFEEL